MLARAPLRWSRLRTLRPRSCFRETAPPPRLSRSQLYSIDGGFESKSSRSNAITPSRWRVRIPQARLSNQRTFLSETAQTILTPPLVFVGLLLTLWTYKCIMMVLFQDKIIYMPNMPPFSRSEKIEDYAKECKPVVWEERHIKSLDGTNIALCIGRTPQVNQVDDTITTASDHAGKEVVICYFQGNGSSLPPRLPILSNVLKLLNAPYSSSSENVKYTLIGLSYRGYWTSSGRARQSGIELDAQALLQYISKTISSPNKNIKLVLWGQSVGSGVATTAAAKYLVQKHATDPPIAGLVLETPFSGIKSMLIALYPQKWLPYRYLWPFLWNLWDSEAALTQMSSLREKPKILLLPATRDEVVPNEEADKLEKLCNDFEFNYERKDVVSALHNEATIRRDGQQSIAEFIADIHKQ